MIEVRAARIADHPAVGRLTIAAYDAVGRVSDEYRDSLADVDGRTADGTTVLVATDRGEVVGSVTIVDATSEHFEHPSHGDGGFRMLAVAPAAQGRGVGRELLAAVLDHARSHGWRRLAITTMEWMPVAHRMYEAVGFVRRPDLDVRYASGVGLGYVLDLVEHAHEHFPLPGPVPDEPPVFDPQPDTPPGC